MTARRLHACPVRLIAVLGVLLALLAAPSLAAATPTIARFELPGQTAAGGNRTFASSTMKVLWSLGDGTTWACDLHTGSISELTPPPGGTTTEAGGIVGNTAACIVDFPERVYLYDLTTGQAYPEAVPLPAQAGADDWQQTPVLTDGSVLYFASPVSGSDQGYYVATFDPAAHTFGEPITGPSLQATSHVPAISGSNLVYLGGLGGYGAIVADILDESVQPPTATTVTVDPSPMPTYDPDNAMPPAVSGDLVVYCGTHSAGYGYSIYGALIDPVTKTVGAPAALVSEGSGPISGGSGLCISGDLLVWGGATCAALVDTSGATPVAGPVFAIAPAAEQPESVDVAGNLVTWYDKVDGKRMGALINPPLPTSAAPSAASVRHGKSVSLKFRVTDQLWKANVQIQIKNAHNKVVLTLKKSWQPTNKALTARFVCKLAKGSYRFYVKATDVGGLVVKKPAANKLVVR
jgi:hypothetical protein